MSKTRYPFPTVPTPQIDPTAVLDKNRLGIVLLQISSFMTGTKTALDTLGQQFYNDSAAPPSIYRQKNAPDPNTCFEGDLWWDTSKTILNVLVNNKWVSTLTTLSSIQDQIDNLSQRVAALESHYSGGTG